MVGDVISTSPAVFVGVGDSSVTVGEGIGVSLGVTEATIIGIIGVAVSVAVGDGGTRVSVAVGNMVGVEVGTISGVAQPLSSTRK